MFLGIGSPIPEICNLPGQGGAIEVLLDYSNAAVCNNDPILTPTYSPSGGVFSASPSGLNINTSTGVITPTGSTPATYTITYTVSGESSSFTFTINPIQQSTFSYSSSSLEQYGTASPIFASGTTTGGTFSATSGLVINTTTGVLDLANSTIGGPYTVTYTTPGPCATSSTFNVSVTALSTSLVDNNFALSFNGNDEYVNAGNDDSLNITGALSVSVWFKAISSSGGNRAIVNKDQGSGTRVWSLAMNNSNQVYAQFRGASTATVYSPSTTYGDGDWHHALAVYEPSTFVKLYIDGTLVITESTGVPASLTNNLSIPLYIGAYSNFPSERFAGDIDEVAIWNRALPLEDVQRIYNGSSTSGKAANLFSTGLSNGLVYWNRMGD